MSIGESLLPHTFVPLPHTFVPRHFESEEKELSVLRNAHLIATMFAKMAQLVFSRQTDPHLIIYNTYTNTTVSLAVSGYHKTRLKF